MIIAVMLSAILLMAEEEKIEIKVIKDNDNITVYKNGEKIEMPDNLDGLEGLEGLEGIEGIKIIKDMKDIEEIDIEIMGLPGTMNEFTWMAFEDLTDEQEKKIEQFRSDMYRDLIDINADIQKAEIDMYMLINNNADINKLNKEIERIGQLRIKSQKRRMNTFIQIRNMLNDEQKEMFNKIGLGFLGFKEKMIIRKNIIEDLDE